MPGGAGIKTPDKIRDKKDKKIKNCFTEGDKKIADEKEKNYVNDQ